MARNLHLNHHPGNNGAQCDWDWPWHQLRDGRPQRQFLHNGSGRTDKCPHYGSATQGQILLSGADDALPEPSLSSASTSSSSRTTHLCAPGGRGVLCWLEEGQSYTDFVFPCSIYRKLCQVLCSVECSLMNSVSVWPWWTPSSDLPCVISWWNIFTFVSTILVLFLGAHWTVYKKCIVDIEEGLKKKNLLSNTFTNFFFTCGQWQNKVYQRSQRKKLH